MREEIEFNETETEALVDRLLDIADDDLDLVLHMIKKHMAVARPDGSVDFSDVDPERLCHEVQRAVDEKEFGDV